MTAVISPLPRNGWSNSQSDLNNMSAEDVSRIVVPRKSAQRSSSSSSLASSASSGSSTSTSTLNIPAPSSAQSNGPVNGDTAWAARKKPARGLWPSSSKAEPVAGLSNARSQPVAASPSGPSAASAVSALHAPPPHSSSSQQQGQPQVQSNGAARSQAHLDAQAVLNLQPLNGTFERKTIAVPFSPELVRIGRQTNQKTLPTPLNGYFDSKVLSRQHAEIWAERDGKIWIRDVKSSNGTFVNGKRLSQENRDSEPHPLKEADVLELGIDIVSEDQKTVVHHKVAARIDYAGLYSQANDGSEFGDADAASANGIGNQLANQGARGRPTSQASNASNGRFSGAGVAVSNMPAAAYHAKWLQPVTMEQIVKRLNNELKQARAEASSLQNASTYIGSVVTSETPPTSILSPKAITSPSKSLDGVKARFASPPPAPPPSQPLPEAPSEASGREKSLELAFEPSLRRSDTERPTALPSSLNLSNAATNVERSSQILNLVEALSTAQKEIAMQGKRLKEMEAELEREREGRKSAEERATLLETGSAVAATTVFESKGKQTVLEEQADRATDPDSSSLQQRIDLMRAEMDGMKLQMEHYRQRANSAEEESHRDQKTLAEMVENIRKRDDIAKRRAEKKRLNSTHSGNAAPAISTDAEDRELEQLDQEIDEELARTEDRLREFSKSDGEKHFQNGSAGNSHLSITELQQLGKAAIAAAMSPQKNDRGLDGSSFVQPGKSESGQNAMAARATRRQQQLAQTAPYASMLGVVLLGVGLMAYLNGWQKAVER